MTTMEGVQTMRRKSKIRVQKRDIPRKPLCGGNSSCPTYDIFICPSCRGIVGIDNDRANYCADCGQKQDRKKRGNR